MTTKTYHITDAQGFYRLTMEAQICQIEGTPLTPENATDLPLPVLAAEQCAKLVAGAWTVQPDYRGVTVYDQASGARQEWNAPGALPANLATTKSAATLAAELLAGQKGAAAAERELADRVYLRCMTVGAAYPAAWSSYKAALLPLMGAGGVLPARPAFPAGV